MDNPIQCLDYIQTFPTECSVYANIYAVIGVLLCMFAIYKLYGWKKDALKLIKGE